MSTISFGELRLQTQHPENGFRDLEMRPRDLGTEERDQAKRPGDLVRGPTKKGT